MPPADDQGQSNPNPAPVDPMGAPAAPVADPNAGMPPAGGMTPEPTPAPGVPAGGTGEPLPPTETPGTGTGDPTGTGGGAPA